MTKRKTPNKNNLKTNLTLSVKDLLNDNPKRKFNYKQIASLLGHDKSNIRKLVYDVLLELVKSGEIKQVSHGKFSSLNSKSELRLTGRIETTKRGAGYVIVEGEEEDIFIASKKQKSCIAW